MTWNLVAPGRGSVNSGCDRDLALLHTGRTDHRTGCGSLWEGSTCSLKATSGTFSYCLLCRGSCLDGIPLSDAQGQVR